MYERELHSRRIQAWICESLRGDEINAAGREGILEPTGAINPGFHYQFIDCLRIDNVR